jgi:polyisoprenoid-binding protein YceI
MTDCVWRRFSRRVSPWLALVALAACTAPERVASPEADQPADRLAADTGAYYREAAARGDAVDAIDPVRSLAVIIVRRSGALARFGHDHVVASRDITGFIAADAGRADLQVPLDRLTVDEADLRAEEGLDTRPSQADIAGTRANMLEKVLEVERFPRALIQVRDAGRDAAFREVTITLHGMSRTMMVPVRMNRENGALVISGRLAFNQSDFGMTPFSILGGAIRVEDKLELRFLLRARRVNRQ